MAQDLNEDVKMDDDGGSESPPETTIMKEVNELDSFKEIIFSDVTDSVDALPWPEDCDDSETELDNFVSQFTL